MIKHRFPGRACAVLACAAGVAAAAFSAYARNDRPHPPGVDTPSTMPPKAVEKTAWGIRFADPFAWLQPDSPEALAWEAKQDAHARRAARSFEAFNWVMKSYVAQGAEPHHLALGGQPRRRGGRWFWMGRTTDGTASAIRMSLDPKTNGSAIIDSRALTARLGGKVQMLQFEPSPDASKVAFQVERNGELGEWYVLEVATGKLFPVDGRNPFVRPAWSPDSSGFLFNDRAADGRHRLRSIAVATGARSMPEKIFEPSEIALIERGLLTQVSPNGERALVLTGLLGERASMIGDLAGGGWRPFLPPDFRGDCYGAWLDNDTYLAIVTHDAPRGRIVAIPVKTSQDPSTWRALVGESDDVLRCATVIGDRIVSCELHDVSARYRLFNLDGKPAGTVPLPWPASTISVSVSQQFDPSEELIIEHESFIQRPMMSRYDISTATLEPLGAENPPALEGIEVEQRFATSSDGTKVPYFIVHSGDLAPSSPQPTLIEGYGGNGIAWLPRFLNQYEPFVRAGGVFVLANLRGGGEYGKAWSEAGRALAKQNTFDDLYAIAEHLIAAGVTTREKLALTGESNGGNLASVALTQRPDLWRVVVPQFAVIDMPELYPPKDPRLASNVAYFPVLYGDPTTDSRLARLIMGYSPYQNVRQGTAYPAVFVVCGDKDVFAPCFQSRKFAARLQAASTSGRPIELRVWKGVGHWASDKGTWREVNAEWLSFVMRELGMKPKQPARQS